MWHLALRAKLFDTECHKRYLRGVELGVREKNRGERRDALVTAAYELFRERGFVGTTMDDVADRAGLSRRTAFRYFATKDELVFPQREERLRLFERELQPRPGETALATVKRACLEMARNYAASRKEMLAQWRIVEAEPALLGREIQLDRDFEKAIEARFERGGASRRRARVRAAAIVGAVRATLREWLEDGATADLVRLGRETFNEMENGFEEQKR
jgi:AcrR family transcriptional regulator